MPGRSEQSKRNLKCSAEGCLKLSGYFKSRLSSTNENEPSETETNRIQTSEELTETDIGGNISHINSITEEEELAQASDDIVRDDSIHQEENEEDEIDLCCHFTS